MTVRIPKENISDMVLNALGKKRGVVVATAAYQKYGAYAYTYAIKESFWRALFRPKGGQLADGMVNLYDLSCQQKRIKKIDDTNQ